MQRDSWKMQLKSSIKKTHFKGWNLYLLKTSQILWIIKNEISPLKDAIRFFIKNLNDSEQVEK